jgi:hypothetical protein
MPKGWVDDPNWGSDISIWEQMDGPGDTTKASGRKHKTVLMTMSISRMACLLNTRKSRGTTSRNRTNTVNNEALTAELRSACRTYARQLAELAKMTVLPTPQFCRSAQSTRGKGNRYRMGTPPYP